MFRNNQDFPSQLHCYKAVEAGCYVAFILMNNLVHLFKTEAMLSRSSGKMKHFRCCDLVFLEKVANTVLGLLEGNQLYKLITDFYRQTALIVTAHKSLGNWRSALGAPVVTATVMDRLIRRCEMFNIEGECRRLEGQRSTQENLLKDGDGHAE